MAGEHPGGASRGPSGRDAGGRASAAGAVRRELYELFHRAASDRGFDDAAPVCLTITNQMFQPHAAETAAQAGEHAGEAVHKGFNAGETIIEHVANSPVD